MKGDMEVVFEKITALAIDQRKILREQREVLAAQRELGLSLSELKDGVAELRAGWLGLQASQLKLKALIQDAAIRLADNEVNDSSQKVWLDACEARQLLQISDITLRRRRHDGSFTSKKIGKKWFFLRSSLQ